MIEVKVVEKEIWKQKVHRMTNKAAAATITTR